MVQKHKIVKSHLGAIKSIASQTLPSHPCKFGTFVRKITLCPFFIAKGAYYNLLQDTFEASTVTYVGHGGDNWSYLKFRYGK